ncbi:MAG: hypothetical protein Q9187_006233 [Circinaria calcarea]
MANGPLTVETRRRLHEEDTQWPLKAILRIIATASALVATILLAASVSLTNSNFVNHDGRKANDWMDGMALAPVLLSLIYNPVSLFMLLLLRRGKHPHPAIHLTVDLAIWTVSVPALIFTVAGGLFWYWKPAISDHNGNVDCGFFFNEFSKECDPVAYTIGHMEITGIIFLFIVLQVISARLSNLEINFSSTNANRQGENTVSCISSSSSLPASTRTSGGELV